MSRQPLISLLPRHKARIRAVAASLLPVLYLETLLAINRPGELSLAGFALRLGFILSVVALAWAWPYWGWLGYLVTFGAGLAYAFTRFEFTALIGLAFFFAFLIHLAELWSAGSRPWVRAVVFALTGAAAGGFAIGAAQVEARFSEEEFFGAVGALLLAGLWMMLALASYYWHQAFPIPRRKRRAALSPGSAGLLALGLALAASVQILRAYQTSFFPASAPTFLGISGSSPFLCETAEGDGTAASSEEVYSRLLALVEGHPNKGTLEHGLLALTTGQPRWQEAFRDSLLEEARQKRFSGPANSVKYGQYEAAQRVYFYVRMRQAFPDLFSSAEQTEVTDWLAAVNRRAMTAEWVDWLYALATGGRPEGPYENQENGAGLLALLSAAELGEEELLPRNHVYLNRTSRGWEARFRNTDDAFIYQPEWIENAWFQTLYSGSPAPETLRSSFDWLVIQALPDGNPLGYNHPAPVPLAGPMVLGFHLLSEPAYVWLAGRSVDYLESNGRYLSARPGMEFPLEGAGDPPSQGSCLLYGDSGLPNQAGPLAPDKIIFRDGWDAGDTYLRLNLRFTGWHRYKATNSASLLYNEGPLVFEQTRGPSQAWLPAGRSLFRDKRIPRENLNGFVVEQTGLGAALSTLTGWGSPWAQDPPYYARVVKFETGPEMDRSTTLIEDWRGWQQTRTVYFYHDGPIVFVDEAAGPSGRAAALNWHVAGGQPAGENRFILREEPNPADLVLLMRAGAGEPTPELEVSTQAETLPDGEGGRLIQVLAPDGRRLSVVSVFLLDEWAGAEVELVPIGPVDLIRITKDERQIELPLVESDGM